MGDFLPSERRWHGSNRIALWRCDCPGGRRSRDKRHDPWPLDPQHVEVNDRLGRMTESAPTRRSRGAIAWADKFVVMKTTSPDGDEREKRGGLYGT